MTYQLTTHPNPVYLHVQVTGENSSSNVVNYVHEIGEICAKHNHSTVLIEENLQGPGLSMFDIVKVFKSLRSVPQQLHWLIYVDTNPAHDPIMMDFARELAIRRGLRVRLCRSVKEAKEWIEMMPK